MSGYHFKPVREKGTVEGVACGGFRASNMIAVAPGYDNTRVPKVYKYFSR